MAMMQQVYRRKTKATLTNISARKMNIKSTIFLLYLLTIGLNRELYTSPIRSCLSMKFTLWKCSPPYYINWPKSNMTCTMTNESYVSTFHTENFFIVWQPVAYFPEITTGNEAYAIYQLFIPLKNPPVTNTVRLKSSSFTPYWFAIHSLH